MKTGTWRRPVLVAIVCMWALPSVADVPPDPRRGEAGLRLVRERVQVRLAGDVAHVVATLDLEGELEPLRYCSVLSAEERGCSGPREICDSPYHQLEVTWPLLAHQEHAVATKRITINGQKPRYVRVVSQRRRDRSVPIRIRIAEKHHRIPAWIEIRSQVLDLQQPVFKAHVEIAYEETLSFAADGRATFALVLRPAAYYKGSVGELEVVVTHGEDVAVSAPSLPPTSANQHELVWRRRDFEPEQDLAVTVTRRPQ